MSLFLRCWGVIRCICISPVRVCGYLTGLHIQRLLVKAGVPENVFRVVVAEKRLAGGWLLDLPLDGYYFYRQLSNGAI